jgi:predicted  nucleic acid-binding Zn-ribbon protein
MPHQCTDCGHTFPDGSKEMLSGCPDCGGNKFQFFPGEVPPEPPDSDPPDPTDSGVSGRVGRAARSVKNFVERDEQGRDGSRPQSSRDGTTRPRGRTIDSSGSEPSTHRSGTEPAGDEDAAGLADSDGPEDESEGEDGWAGVTGEDEAQVSARSEMVDPDTLPPDVDGEVVDTPSGERPDMATLREELNDQFESIRIVDKGQYELNLMELYDREEYIIALQENGRYVIEVPDAWRNPEE